MAGKPIEDPAPKTNPSWARLDVGIGFLLGLGPFGRENRIRIEIRRNDSKRGLTRLLFRLPFSMLS